MRIFGTVDLKGITKIVINRIVVWERVEDKEGKDVVWVKIAGGKGYNPEDPLICPPAALMGYINEMLVLPQKKTLPCGDTIVVGPAYRAWPAGDTLNIGRIDAEKKRRGKKEKMENKSVKEE